MTGDALVISYFLDGTKMGCTSDNQFRNGLLVDELGADLVARSPNNPAFTATVRQNESESVGDSPTRSPKPNTSIGHFGYQAITRWRLAASLNFGSPN